jgi:hypothetical protein
MRNFRWLAALLLVPSVVATCTFGAWLGSTWNRWGVYGIGALLAGMLAVSSSLALGRMLSGSWTRAAIGIGILMAAWIALALALERFDMLPTLLAGAVWVVPSGLVGFDLLYRAKSTRGDTAPSD